MLLHILIIIIIYYYSTTIITRGALKAHSVASVIAQVYKKEKKKAKLTILYLLLTQIYGTGRFCIAGLARLPHCVLGAYL